MLEIKSRVDAIIEARRDNLPRVEEQASRVGNTIQQLNEIEKVVSSVLGHGSKLGEDNYQDLLDCSLKLTQIGNALSDAEESLTDLAARFNRSTLNIGVSGAARVGKSTTLQSFSGLDDDQIPTGDGLTVTAVRSAIYNKTQGKAVVQLRNEKEYLDDLINPAFSSINEYLDHPLHAGSIEEFARIELPNTLGDNIPSKASTALSDLHDAQCSLAGHRQLLSGASLEVPLCDVRQYVAYPSQEEQETSDRWYLAVKSASIYNHFPLLDNAPICLVDLPGLGEIDPAKAEMHMRGLENDVDQVLLIMKPTKEKGFVDDGIAGNIDQLRKIQPGIHNRGSLIVAAINHDDRNGASAETLKADFEKRINRSQASDRIEILDYCAIEQKSVDELFEHILTKLVDDLPVMDQQALEHVFSTEISSTLEQFGDCKRNLLACCHRIIKTIPLEASYLAREADALSRRLISQLNQLEERRYLDINQESSLKAGYEESVEEIFQHNESALNAGLFLGNEQTWGRHALGRGDYASFFRAEARRIRAELVESYRGMDIYYDRGIEDLKAEILDTFFDSTGAYRENLQLDESTSTEIIQTLSESLDASTRSDGLSRPFRFLLDLKYKFSQNVFYNLFESLETLHNPEIDYTRFELRGMSETDKIVAVHNELLEFAHAGNKEIRGELKNFSDQFNRYLFTCVSFFNDFLYRRDELSYSRCIELLVDCFREQIIPSFAPQIHAEYAADVRRLRDLLGESDRESSQDSCNPGNAEDRDGFSTGAKSTTPCVEKRNVQKDKIAHASNGAASTNTRLGNGPTAHDDNGISGSEVREALSHANGRASLNGDAYRSNYDQAW